jgi:chromosome segregation ATPase
MDTHMPSKETIGLICMVLASPKLWELIKRATQIYRERKQSEAQVTLAQGEAASKRELAAAQIELAEIASDNHAIELLMKLVENLQDTVQRLEKRIEKLELDRIDLVEKLAAARIELARLEVELAESRQHSSELEKDLKDARLIIEKLSSQIAKAASA